MDVSKQGLRVIVSDADTEEPIQGIPVSCKQIGSRWDNTSLTTDEKGEVFFDLLPSALNGFVSYSVNFGSYFGYDEIDNQNATVYLGGPTIRRHVLHRKEVVHEAPSTVPIPPRT